MYYIAKTPNHPTPAPYLPVGEMLSSPSFFGLIICLALMGLVKVSENFSGKKEQLALGRWAGERERQAAFMTAINQIKTRKIPDTGVILERPGNKAETVPTALPEMQRGCAIMGGPGSGKTYSGFLPIMYSSLDQGFPCVVYDFKYPELTEKVAGYAAKRGYNVRVFAPGYPESDTVNILDFLDPKDPSMMAGQFAEVLQRNYNKGDQKGGDRFFAEAGDALVQAVLMLAKESPYPDIMMCQSLLSLDNLAKRIQDNAENIKYTTYLTFSNLRASAGSEKTVAGIIATATNMFTRFMKPRLLRNLTGKTTLNLDLKGKEMLVVGLDQETRDVLAPLAGSILDLVITRNTAKRRDDPLFFYFDEAPTVNLPRIVNWLNEMRSRGLCTVLGFQNIVQMERLYGKDLTKAIWGGCATKLIYNPQEYESAKLISEYLGREQIEYEQTSHSRGQGGGSKSVSQQKQTRSLLDSADLLQFPTGERIVINPGFKGGKVPGFPQMTKAYVPLREKPDLSSNQLFQGAVSQSITAWQQILPKLKQRAAANVVTDEIMKARFEAAKAFLPFKDDKDKQAAQSSTPNSKKSWPERSTQKKQTQVSAAIQDAVKFI